MGVVLFSDMLWPSSCKLANHAEDGSVVLCCSSFLFHSGLADGVKN